MNKKLFLGMFAASATMLATSCSSDDILEQNSGEMAQVTFAINTEGATASRAINDGTTVNKLYYRVFDENGAIIAGQPLSTENIVNKQATVTVSLAKGKKYDIAFFAQKDGVYTVSENMVVDMNYETTNNNENRDAFFANLDDFVAVDGVTNTVTLHRPFAQLNVGTKDFDAAANAGVAIAKSSVTISGVATTLDVLTGEVSGETNVTYSLSTIPSEVLTIEGNDYKWLSMCYILPTETTHSTLVNTTFTFTDGTHEITLSKENVPVQRNFRTNLLGKVLTNSAEFDVIIDENFQGAFNENNGNIETKATFNEATNSWEVANAEQWNSIRYSAGQNITLTADIDFAGNVAKPIYSFNGTFDGNNHSMSNYKTTTTASGASSGLFSGDNIHNKTIVVKNLTIKNATVDCPLDNPANAHGWAGAIFGDISATNANVTIEGVTIDGSSIKGVQGVGSLVGFLAANSTLTVKNTKVINNNLSNYEVANESGFVCGLVGKIAGTLNISDGVELSNNTIVGRYANTNKRGARSINEVAATASTTAGTINGTVATKANNNVVKAVIGATIISNKEELLAFAQIANSTNAALAADIDLAGINWTPICNNGTNDFYGIFDGNGKTISNLTVDTRNSSTSAASAGFIGWLGNTGVVRDLIIDNASIKGSHYVGAVVGYIEGGKVDNCTVKNSTISCTYNTTVGDDGDKCGGIAGYMHNTGITNCTVSNTNIDAVRDAGQILGCKAAGTLSGNKAENVTVSANDSANGTSSADKKGQNIKNEEVGRTN